MTRPRRTRLAGGTLAVVVVAALTVLLAQVPVGASFTATTLDDGNSVRSADNFCLRTDFLSPAGVAWTDQAAPTVNHGDESALHVQSGPAGSLRRTWVRFDLPAAKPGCTLQAATLRVYNSAPSDRIIDVYRGDPRAPIWSPQGITWADQPARAGDPVGGSRLGTTPVQQIWGLTSEVKAQYFEGNNGFVLQDRYETNGTAAQLYDGSPDGSRPIELQLDWA